MCHRLITEDFAAARSESDGGVQVTRFAAPLAYNYLHVIRMQEYLGADRVRLFSWQPIRSHATMIACMSATSNG